MAGDAKSGARKRAALDSSTPIWATRRGKYSRPHRLRHLELIKSEVKYDFGGSSPEIRVGSGNRRRNWTLWWSMEQPWRAHGLRVHIASVMSDKYVA